MEGKTMILSLLIMSLVMAQIQVEAKICCPDEGERYLYDKCRSGGGPESICALAFGCKIISGNTCPSGYTKDIMENLGDGVNEYCKLGCTSSVCGAMNHLKNSDTSEIVNGAVEQCVKACSTFCAKSSKIAVEAA